MKTRLIVVGGFLGAGKTTAIARLARALIDKGGRVGVVTNDQGNDLVDTQFLRSQGIEVGEVTGGCFCCNFDQFIERIGELSRQGMPDFLLAEPVGSCTDLIATVFKPLLLEHTRHFDIAPFSVLCDPRRVRKLMERGGALVSDIDYLFQKQVQEADILLLNKCDTLDAREVEALCAFLSRLAPGAQVLPVSMTGGGHVDEWLSMLCGESFAHKPSLDIDYDTYAAAEARLGWLNASMTIRGAQDAADFLTCLLSTIAENLSQDERIAHLKAYLVGDQGCVKASVVANDDAPQLSGGLDDADGSLTLVINARAEATPERLREAVESALKAVCGIRIEGYRCDSFVPGRPNPTHRIR